MFSKTVSSLMLLLLVVSMFTLASKIQARADPATLTVSVNTYQGNVATTYDYMVVAATVEASGSPVSGALVTFTDSFGSTFMGSTATTNSSGVALTTVQFNSLNTGSDTINANASATGYNSGIGSATVSVLSYGSTQLLIEPSITNTFASGGSTDVVSGTVGWFDTSGPFHIVPVADATITITDTIGSTFSSATIMSDNNGFFSSNFTIATVGTSTIDLVTFGASCIDYSSSQSTIMLQAAPYSTSDLTVAMNTFFPSATSTTYNYMVIEAEVTAEGVPVSGASVTFSDSFGSTFMGSTATTNSSGVALTTVQFNSGNTGIDVLTASASESGYSGGVASNIVSVLPYGSTQLLIEPSITNTFASGGSTDVVSGTVGWFDTSGPFHIVPVADATITFVDTLGSVFNVTSVLTNSQGYFSASFTLPTITATSDDIIMVSASEPGYSGSSSAVYMEATPGNSQTYSVSFSESGLVQGTREWSVTFNGVTGESSNTITFYGVEDGTYSYTVNSVTSYIASPQTGSILVNGTSVNDVITFTSAPYTLDFLEDGLPQGAQWSVTLTGQALPSAQLLSSFSQAITFNVPSPSVYSYDVTFPQGYTLLPATSDVGVTPSLPATLTYLIFVPNSNAYSFTSWDPVQNSYNLNNPSTGWSSGGNCYGFASTALLYFLGQYTNPYLPLQSPQANSTSELNLATDPTYTTLNNAWLAIVLHQFYDQNSNLAWWYKDLATVTEALQFNNLNSSLTAQTPAVLGMWDSSGNAHAVVAFGIGKLEDGTYAIAVYDPDYPESTQVAFYYPSSGTFAYETYVHFVVIHPTTIDMSFFSGWASNSGPSLSKQFTGYTMVATDKEDSTVTIGGSSDSFTSSGNSQSFVCGITGSSGIEEGDFQVYAIPQSMGMPSADPASNESVVFISWVDNESGYLVGHAYFLNATTTQGLLNFTATPSSAGLSINAGDNALNATITCFSATEQGYSVSDVMTAQIDAGQNVNFTAPCSASFTASKTVVGQGYPVSINVTITNAGNNPENVTLTLCANGTTLGSEMVYNLMNGTSVNLACLENTSSCAYGNYTLSIYCQPSGVNEAANNFTYTGVVTVTIPGDVDGNGMVNMGDIVSLCAAFGSTPGQPNWNPNCDIEGNGRIDMGDIVIACANFGQHYP